MAVDRVRLDGGGPVVRVGPWTVRRPSIFPQDLSEEDREKTAWTERGRRSPGCNRPCDSRRSSSAKPLTKTVETVCLRAVGPGGRGRMERTDWRRCARAKHAPCRRPWRLCRNVRWTHDAGNKRTRGAGRTVQCGPRPIVRELPPQPVRLEPRPPPSPTVLRN